MAEPTVIALNATVRIADDRKAAFLDAVAQSYERYVADFGEVPDALACVMGGLKQRARVSYEINGASRDGAISFLALATMALTKEIVNPD